jgi:MazG family protein
VARQEFVIDPPTPERLLELISALRGENGCPWDRKQTPASLSVYLIEEVYELVEAIAADDEKAIKEELGDVFFQVMFMVHLYQQAGRITLDEVVSQNLKKMVHRHPHVFGDDKIETAGQVKQRWREIKRLEKDSVDSLMDSVPSGTPALMRAYRISERAAGTGFDWDAIEGVLAQTEAEWVEFKAEINNLKTNAGEARKAAELEFGDILFTLVNVARLAGIHPEMALIRATEKFINRFKQMEAMAANENTTLDRMTRDDLEKLWIRAKKG